MANQSQKNPSYEESLLIILRENKDEDKSFFLSLVPAFKKLTDTQKIDAKMEFLSTLKRITLLRPEASYNMPFGHGTSSNYGLHGLAEINLLIKINNVQNLHTRNYSSGSSTPNLVQVVAVINPLHPSLILTIYLHYNFSSPRIN